MAINFARTQNGKQRFLIQLQPLMESPESIFVRGNYIVCIVWDG